MFIHNDWDLILKQEFEQPYMKELFNQLHQQYETEVVYPPKNEVFHAFQLTPYSEVKVVILGQDPYHGEGEAHGLAFSVKPGIAIPPSLRNMYKELRDSLGCYIPNNGYLVKWAKQGVLLLNTALTVRKDTANSHRGKGWENFTSEVIRKLNGRQKPVIFLLWGSNAKEKAELIDKRVHHVLTSVHPSPLSASRGFFGCNHFKKANDILIAMNEAPIDWQIENI